MPQNQTQSNMPYGRSTGEDGLLVFACSAIIIGAALYAAWWFYHAQISAAVIFVAHKQMQFISLLTNRYAALDAQVLVRDPSTVKVPALWRLMHNVGLFFRIPAILVLLALAVWCFLRNAPSQFTRDLDLPGLMRTQAETFPAAAAFVRRSLGLVLPAAGEPRPADPALKADEWIAAFARTKDGRYSESRAVAELHRQIGPRWTGAADATPAVRCMLAVFVLHAARQRSEAVALLGALSKSLPDGRTEGPTGPDAPLAFSAEILANADAILSNKALARSCLDAAARHAFTAPAVMAVLTHARSRAGVLAPAQFAFLKLVDRRLWYALHSLGFPANGQRTAQPNPRIEALGARDHWAAECDAGRALIEPSLERAAALIGDLAGKTAANTNTTPETAA